MKGMFDRFLDRVENLDRDLFDPLRRSRSNFWIQKRIHDHGGREREKKYDPLQKMVSSWGGGREGNRVERIRGRSGLES